MALPRDKRPGHVARSAFDAFSAALRVFSVISV